MPAVSVIICSHNPREDYLQRVLDALKAQTLPVSDWELLLVDNASATPLSGRFKLSWHPNARQFSEEKIGLTYARIRGIAESKAELLVFVDDDNVLRRDYLQTCLKLSAEYPFLGAWGGSCIPEYEIAPPEDLRPWLWGLLTEKVAEPLWARLPIGGIALPPGAGMAVRRKVAEYYREQVLRDPMRQALDRSGGNMGAGGDSDMALSGRSVGFGAGRFPELELTHLIPAARLKLDYFEQLFEGFGYGGVVLQAIHDHDRRYPGQMESGALKIFLLQCLMFFTGKSRADRRIRLAEERGRLAARRELAQMSRLPPPAGT